MQDEAHREMRRFQVIQDLSLSNWIEHQPGFCFDDHRLLDHEVCLVRPDRHVAVGQLISNQLLDRDATTSKLDSQGFPVDRLEKAIPKRAMDVNERLDDLSCETL